MKNLFCFALSLFLIFSIAEVKAQSQLHVVRGDGNYPPNEMGTAADLSGVHIDMVNSVAKSLKIEVKWESVPWARAQTMIKNGEADAITYIGKSTEREEYVHFLEGNELMHSQMGLVALKEIAAGLAFKGDLASLKAVEPVITQRGYNYGENFSKSTLFSKFEVKDIEQVLLMLKEKKYKIGIVNVGETKPIARKMGLYEEIEFIQPLITDIPNYIGFSKKKDTLEIAQKFAIALRALKNSPQFREILNKYGAQ